MDREGLPRPRSEGVEVFVVALGEEAQKESRALIRSLREQGIAADAPLEERPMKAQLKMADRAGARYAAILGEQELSEGLVTLRRMEDGQQERVKLSEVATWLTR
jgi:histidyl-tRNA synthetase